MNARLKANSHQSDTKCMHANYKLYIIHVCHAFYLLLKRCSHLIWLDKVPTSGEILLYYRKTESGSSSNDD